MPKLALLLLLASTISFANSNTNSFIDSLLPKIRSANSEILAQREFLLNNKFSTDQDRVATINSIASKYKVKKWQITSPKAWDRLLSKVNAWPESLVLAQAILESGFGKSRFATKANNLFGIWCFSKGCGIVPLQRSANALHEIRKFASVQEGIEFHLYNLNTHPAYKKLRASRNKMLSSIELCKDLHQYSAQGSQYAINLAKLINKYNLQKWDI